MRSGIVVAAVAAGAVAAGTFGVLAATSTPERAAKSETAQLRAIVTPLRANVDRALGAVRAGKQHEAAAALNRGAGDGARILSWLATHGSYADAHAASTGCFSGLELDELGAMAREAQLGDVQTLSRILRGTGNCYSLGSARTPAAARPSAVAASAAQADSGLDKWHYQNAKTVTELGDVFFSGANNGWIVGGENPEFNGGLHDTMAIVRHTTNGGGTWKEDSGSKAAEGMAGQDSSTGHELKTGFAVGDHVWIIGEADDGDGIGSDCFNTAPSTSNDAIILHSSDGGNTWTRQHTTPLTCGDIESIFMFPDAKHGIIGTNDGNYYTTADRGSTWTQHANPSGGCAPGNFADSITFPPQPNKPWDQWEGWGADCGIFHTTDGGQTWTEQTVDAQTGTCTWEQVYAVSTKSVMAVAETPNSCGTYGNIATYDSGTGTWTTMFVGDASDDCSNNPQLHDVVGLTKDLWYVMGESCNDDNGATMFVTKNGGSTWSEITPPGGTAALSVSSGSFTLNQNHAWAVGQEGTVIAFTP